MIEIMDVAQAKKTILSRNVSLSPAYPPSLLQSVEDLFGEGMTPEDAVVDMVQSHDGLITVQESIDAWNRVVAKNLRARNVGRDIFAGLKNLVGGEIDEYTKLQAQSREEALQRMIQDAEKLGADAVLNVRFTTSTIVQGASEILAYGTAVKLS